MRERIVLSAVLLLAAAATRLYADPIRLSGSGVVASLGNEEDVCVSCAMEVLGFSFAVGDSLSVSLSFEPPVADLAPGDPGFGAYGLGSGTLEVVGGGRFTAPAVSDAQILNTAGGPGLVADEILLGANPPGRDLPSRIGVVFYGSDLAGTWLPTDEWPADLAATLNAAPFSAVWLFDRTAEHGTFATLGNVEFAQAPVPEPATTVLVAMGLAGIGVRRWRQHRRG